MIPLQNPQVLRTSKQFRRVYELGRKFHTPFFTAFILRSETEENRFGITVTRKIGGAVIRNRCKRRFRDVIRRYFSQEIREALPGFDMVINVKAEAVKAEFAELEQAFTKTMHRCAESPAESDRAVPLR